MIRTGFSRILCAVALFTPLGGAFAQPAPPIDPHQVLMRAQGERNQLLQSLVHKNQEIDRLLAQTGRPTDNWSLFICIPTTGFCKICSLDAQYCSAEFQGPVFQPHIAPPLTR